MLSISAMAQQFGLSLARVGAIDGKKLSRFHTPLVQQSSSQEIVNIPMTDVELTWNSQLNAKFDRSCRASSSVEMSHSERACAATHLAGQ